jgi:putative membrane protein
MVTFVAISHYGFMVLEMFFWNHPTGRKIFSMIEEFSAMSAPLAANQGLYNGFLATGLIWGLLSKQTNIKIFFLCCVVIAGIFGSITAKSSILYTQAFPAVIALALVWIVSRKST